MYKQIKTFEDACKALKIGTELPDVSMLPEQHAKAIVAHYKLMVIAQALNEGWFPNWNDHNEWKYYPWFDVAASKEQSSGFGLSYDDYDCGYSGTSVGSRLVFKTKQLAEYAGNQFLDIYNDFLTIK